ncbi:hypothetical protein [Klebsiella quasipneumoniae]|uniref:hypothetical protein n=1 Tax=Klebsiella quasipneumoniae TaxID=1463165 RepID=UPI003D8141A6
MTDITELAQNPTRYGTNSQGVFTNQTDGAYVSYLDFVALVEEMEKAQRYIEELREWNAGLAQESFERQQRISELLEGKVGNALLERENHHVEVVGKLTEHITELESEVEKWKQEAEVWEQVAEKQLATAIELESRTVKLVDCDFGAVQHVSGGSADYCHGFVDGTQNAIRAITATGIKVEAE